MTLASYFSRVHDAVAPLTAITGPELAALLDGSTVHVDLAPATTEPAWVPGVRLLGNLLGRLYPSVSVTGPPRAVELLSQSAHRSNPAINLDGETSGVTTTLRFGDHQPGADVSLMASAWLVTVDGAATPDDPPQPLAALAAACIASAEVFRHAFVHVLSGRGRTDSQPGAFELITGDPERPAPNVELTGLTLPPSVLAGAGAVGQACALALAASGAKGHLTAVDPEDIELTNVQRYVLTAESDVGSSKVDLLAWYLTQAGWTVDPVRTAWGADSRSAPGQDLVLVALDTARDRIAVGAGVHGRVYNAWTQPADVGWSRHEYFGTDPCLACLYYPATTQPSDDELIAHAIKQPRLRVLSYLVTGAPIGLPLPQVVEVADLPLPANAASWTHEPLIQALTADGVVPPDQEAAWAPRSVGDLYTAGICGGGLVTQDRSGLPAEVVVPLAHQSALAGIMLALQVIAATVPQLKALRHRAVEARLDLLAGFPQISPRPRERTAGCLCRDAQYQAAWPPSRPL